MTGAVGGTRSTGATSGVSRASRAPAVDSATLSADDGGNLTLKPVGDHPINVSRGRDGRYHVDVGGQDIAFTPEQMNRLDIKAGARNPVKIGQDVDLPVKVNGQPHGPGSIDEPHKIQGKGFDSVPEVAADRYEAARTSTAGTHQGLQANQALDKAAQVDANRSVKGNNWDSVGVPPSDGTARAEKGRDADGPDKAGRAEKNRETDKGEKAEEPEEKKKKKAEEEKKKKGVQVAHMLSPGEDKVEIKDTPEVLIIEFHESLERWKEFFRAMSAKAGDALDFSVSSGAGQAEVSGALADAAMQRMSQPQETPPDAVQESSASADADNRRRQG